MTRPDKRSSRSSGLAKHSRHKKVLFLPMDRGAADDLVLPVRIAFERVRQGKADQAAAFCMTEVLLLTGFLTKSGFGRLENPFLAEAEQRLLAEMNRVGTSDELKLDDQLVDALAVVVNEYDRLMRETRLQAIVDANEHFARLRRASVVSGR